MANEARFVRSSLAALKTQLATAIPAALDDVAADGGLRPVDPTGCDASSRITRELQPTRIKIYVEGSSDLEQYMTPQVNVVIPLSVLAIMAESDDPETNDQRAHEMCRAIDIALSRTWTAVPGAFWYRTGSTIVLPDPTPNTSQHRRIALVRGTLKVRTTRVEA